MKVLRLTPHYYFEQNYWPSRYDPIGGQQVQVTQLSEWLSKKNIYQDVLTTGLPGVRRELLTNNNLVIHSIRFLTLPFKSSYGGTILLDFSWALGAIKWMIKNSKKKEYDLIHLHSSGVIWPFIVAWIAIRIFKTPLVTSIHCSRHFTYSNSDIMDKIKHPFVKHMEKLIIKKSEIVYLLTEKTKCKYVDKFEGWKKKFLELSDSIGTQHLIHNEKIDCCENNLQKYNFPAQRKILYLGRISYEKGWELFIEIAREITKDKSYDDLVFVVCGDGPQYSEFKKKVEEYNLSHRFFITGFISKEVIPCVLKNSDVLVVPSKHEELGGVAIEGAYAEIPIIASDVGGLSTLIEDGITGFLVKPEDITGFVDKLKFTLDNPIYVKKLTEASKDNASNRFEGEYIYSNLLKDYKQLI